MSYRLRITKVAEKEISQLPGNFRQRIRRAVRSLADTPRPTAAKELRNLPNCYRIRLNGWRIIYRIEEEDQIVLVLTVRRKTGPETYENIE